MNKKYETIINLEHHKSERYFPMSKNKRAAQFSPFAALKGFEESLDETRHEEMMKFEEDGSF